MNRLQLVVLRMIHLLTCVCRSFNAAALLPVAFSPVGLAKVRIRILLVFVCVSHVFVCVPHCAAKDGAFFIEHVVPIFAEHCVRCHDGSGESDVLLVTADDLMNHQWIIAGEYDSSELRNLVEGTEPRMPPEGDRLNQQELDTLRTWVDRGAFWPDGYRLSVAGRADESWWSLQPVHDITSERSESGLSKSAFLDALIQRRLEAEGLTRSPRADRRTLIRRLAHDLWGLPPMPEQVQRFVEDRDPAAWERLVDQMLDSPHYGERYATHWLDLAHYADTHGFERDQRRPNAWRYRDYVIDSLNADKPYPRFLTEQIAGDILWPQDPDAVVATGFLSAGPWDFVGQVETKSPVLRRSSRVLDLDDMVTQVMTATIGMTVHCARCHDHKLDPISQAEYYQLQAVFAGVTRGDRLISKAAMESYETQKKELSDRRRQATLHLGRLEGRGLSLADIVGGGDGLGGGEFRVGIDPRTAKVQRRDFGSLGNVVVNHFSRSDHSFIDGVFIADGGVDGQAIEVSSAGTTITGLPKTSGMAWDAIRNGPVASQHSPALDGIDFTKSDHDLLGLHANAGVTFDLSALREAIGQAELLFQTQVGYFGSDGDYRADVWVAVDGEILWKHRELKRDDGLQPLDLEISANAKYLTLIATDGGNGYAHDQIGFGDARLMGKEKPLLTDADKQTKERLTSELSEIEQAIESLGAPPRVYGVVSKEVPDEIRSLRRGDPESPFGERLQPGALGCVGELDSKFGDPAMPEGERRVALAKWISDPRHPLTYRVIANRIWLWHFGRALVSTPSDFGAGGASPTHPELLDWLASELKRSGGSLKALHRLILRSETYCQESVEGAGSESARQDSLNESLWRQNARRLSAEAIRDSVLAVSGNLNRQRGGPGYEDFDYTEAYAPIYQYKVADEPDLWRRSIYRYVVRTTPNEFLTTFDCPDPASLTPNRLTTTTPLQSLALFNNEFLLRQSQAFADRLREEVGSVTSQQVVRAFELAYGRRPDGKEQEHAEQFVNAQGLFALCRVIFNSNEFLYVD